jgi:hypothetical protein
MSIKLLVTTARGLFFVDGQNVHLVQRGACYGISWDEYTLYVCHRHPTLHTEIWLFDHSLRLLNKMPAKSVCRVHQALYDDKHELLYMTNTDRNRVEIWDPAVHEFASFNYTGRSDNWNHINSIYRYGECIYVGEQNGKRDFNCRVQEFYDSDLEHPINTYQLENEGHNIFIRDGMLYSLMSLDRTLIQMDMATKQIVGRKEFHLPKPHFKDYPRGFAVGSDFFVIGQSCWGTPQERKDDRAGYVTIVDQETLEIRDVIRLPQVNQVFCLRLISELDWAHNGIPFGAHK